MPYDAYSPNRTISGSNFFVTVTGWPDDAPPGHESYCHYLTSWELINSAGQAVEHVAVEYSYLHGTQPAHDGVEGKPWCGYPPLYLEVLLQGGQVPGAYTFRFTITCIPSTQQTLAGGASQTLEVPVFIAQMPIAVDYNQGHPIPNLTAWENHMIELADKWQPELLAPGNSWGDDNWYYDICSTYLEISKYLHDSERYWDVAYHSICRYRDYLVASNGVPAPWCVFPRGLRQMYQSTRDPAWLDLIKGMTAGGWVPSAGSTDPMMMREGAYATAVWLELEWVDAGNRELLDRGITYLLGQFNLLCAQQFHKGQGMVCEPFFFGLAMQTLTDYYDFVADPRIPQSLMGTCAWLWENAADKNSGYVKYDCWTPTTDWYTGLNPLFYNGWGFLYNVTGDDLWRRQGDILFEHQFDDGGYAWSPKQFAQMYRRSTDYVTRWRA